MSAELRCFFFLIARRTPPKASADIIQKIADVPNAAPNAPKINGRATRLAWMIVNLSPRASAISTSGVVECTSVMMFGWAEPRPRPITNAINRKNKYVSMNGNIKKHTEAHASVLISICHSVVYFVSNGINSRMANVASANEPSMNPIFDAESPTFEP